MASSYSTDLKLELMVTGENAGTWGDITNTNLNLLQQAIGGYQEVSIAGGAQTTTLVMSNAALSNARNAVIKLIGTITGNQIVTVPDGIEKTYIVSNGTTGAFTVQFKTVSGTGVTFAATDKSTKQFFVDGTNVVDAGYGDVTLTGTQTLTNKTLTTPIISSISNTGTVTLPTATDTLVGRATTDTLTNKTLTAPKYADGGFIADANGNEEIKFTTTASAVNEITVANAATGSSPIISATGGDTNVGITLTPKGSGNIVLSGIKYPTADGSANQALVTNGSGVLSFAAVGASAGQVIQVVTATDQTQRSTTSQSFVTGSNTLSVTITPSSASNKILVLLSTSAYGSTAQCFVTIYRGSTNLGNGNNGMMSGGIDINWNASCMIYDSPATTSATTYQAYFRHTYSSGVSFLNAGSEKCSITVLEIKG